jgi:DNA-nicking Smr family endonuclease
MRNRAGVPEHADDDAAAFTESIRGARKLEGGARVPVVPQTSRPILPNPPPGATAATAGGASLVIEEGGGGSWSARADGVSPRILRRMRGGLIPVEAHLDLHGLTRGQAAESLDRFLATARQTSRRCLLVIHGRGLHSGPEGPALRDLVRERLTRGVHAQLVLACASAAPDHGGAGATVLYLRR